MKLPILMQPNGLSPAAPLHPLDMTLNLRMAPLSTARMTLGRAEAIQINDYVQIDPPNGGTGIYKAVEVETDSTTGRQRVLLEHALNDLANDVILGEANVGEDGAKASIRDAISFVLGKQKVERWRLGTCSVARDGAWSFSDVDLLTALLGLTDDLTGFRWAFDQSTVPWTVSLLDTTADTDAACEMRLSRNISSMTVTLDRTGLYTRLYCKGKDGLTIDPLEQNVARYGLVAAVYENPNIDNADELAQRGRELIEEHSHPVVSVEIDGLELSEATGEPMDRLQLGRICRVPLNGEIVTERITELTWPDLLGRPQQVSVTMANSAATFTGAMRYADQFVRQVTRTSGSISEGIHSTVEGIKRTPAGIKTLKTSIDQGLSYISLTASAILGKDTPLEHVREAMLKVTADGILGKVIDGDITSVINQSAGEVLIQASKINLEGYVTATELDAQNARITILETNSVTANNLAAKIAAINALGVQALSASSISSTQGFFGSLAIDNKLITPQKMTVSGNDVGTFYGTAPINFTIADTQEYKDGVSAARNSVQILASDITARDDATYYSSTQEIYVTVDAEADNGNGNSNRIGVDASKAYQDGADSVSITTSVLGPWYNTTYHFYSANVYVYKNGEQYGDPVIVSTGNQAWSAGFEDGYGRAIENATFSVNGTKVVVTFDGNNAKEFDVSGYVTASCSLTGTPLPGHRVSVSATGYAYFNGTVAASKGASNSWTAPT